MAPVPREKIREWDRKATEVYGIPSLLLMENAARGSADALIRISEAEAGRHGSPYQVICGPGSNGGDGLALARHLHNRGLAVTIHLVEPRARIRPATDSWTNLEIVLRMRLDVREPRPDRLLPEALAEATGEGTLIDALLGTGLERPLRTPYLEWVEAINRSGRPVIAIDVPTGLHADTGAVLGAAVRASHTLTMAAPKLGFTRGEGPACTGQVHVIDIGIPRELLEE